MDSYQYHLISELQAIFRDTLESERKALARDAEMSAATKPQGRARRG